MKWRVGGVNSTAKVKDVSRAEKSIEYLNQQIAKQSGSKVQFGLVDACHSEEITDARSVTFAGFSEKIMERS